MASRMKLLISRTLIITGVFLLFSSACTGEQSELGLPIQPYPENPFYWQYQEEPLLLLGGSAEDNLFNHPGLEPDGLEAHLDDLVANGGNYLRNTMSSRNPGNLFPYRADEDGVYDLSDWNEEYWERFERYLEMTHEKGIIVQLELWDPWDLYRSEGIGVTDFRMGNTGWESHPFNPLNNRNYTAEESGLATEFDFFPSSEPTSHSFFHTVPEMDHNQVILAWQQAFVDKILSYTLEYPHILYCMNNETGEDVRWGDYWIRYVRDRAAEAGREIYVTDMRRNERINGPDHRYIHDQPDLYTYVEISQNNGTSVSGQRHGDAILEAREYLKSNPRPMNNNKIYGGEDGWGGTEEAQQKFWRNLFTGSASARFHRPPAGLGLNELAKKHLRSMRLVEQEIHWFQSVPANDRLSERSENEAWLFAEHDVSYAIYFPGDGAVSLDLTDSSGEYLLRWLVVDEGDWSRTRTVEGGRNLLIETPGNGHQVALLTRPQ